MTEFDLVLVGFGNVARRFVTLLREERAVLAHRYDLRTRIVGISTRRHGEVYSAAGLNGPALARLVERGRRIGAIAPAPGVAFVRDAVARSAAAARQGRLVVVEATTLDIMRGEPAASHVRAALAGGAHVITVNKGPVACAYRSLARDAARAGRRFLFEGTVMDGVPIFNLARETLPAVNIVGFRGVVNSTTNYVLTAMERGQPFDAALAQMKAVGIAEADASLDIDGWDAAAKTAALANVLLGARLTPRSIGRQGIAPADGRRAIDARAAGRRLKLVARAQREGRAIVAAVGLEDLPAGDLLAGLDGPQNAVVFQTDLLEEIAVVQRSGGLTQTAYALVSDLVTIARDLTAARATPRSRAAARRRRSPR